jgi:hypothetical protein
MNRRGFVAAAGGGLLLAGPVWARGVIDTAPASLGALYRQFLAENFIASSPAGSTAMQLESVTDGPQQPGIEQFQLVFRGREAPLASGIYQVRTTGRPALRRRMYLEAQPDDSTGQLLRATFSLLT